MLKMNYRKINLEGCHSHCPTFLTIAHRDILIAYQKFNLAVPITVKINSNHLNDIDEKRFNQLGVI